MPRKKVEQPEIREETGSEEATGELALAIIPLDTSSGNNSVIKEEDVTIEQTPPLSESPQQDQETEAPLQMEVFENDVPPQNPIPTKKRRAMKKKNTEPMPTEQEAEDAVSALESTPQPKPPIRRRNQEPAILTIASGNDVATPDAQEETAWHEVRNAYRTRRVLTGTLSGLEPTENGRPVAIVNYNDYRVVIPISEMLINLNDGPNHYGEMQTRQSKILGNMIGAEVDFVIKGIESKSRSIVASRKDAMMRKRKLFYFETDAQGMYRIYEGRIVQARVIAVAEKVIRVEVFGVECPIPARNLTYDWLGDARDRYNVGDEILIRIQQVQRDDVETLSIQADVKSVAGEADRDNLKKCRIQGKYAGTITDIHRGVVFIRLAIGVNAIAHSCYDRRTPGKKDEVSFAVTHLDEERNVAVGIITRIMRRNL